MQMLPCFAANQAIDSGVADSIFDSERESGSLSGLHAPKDIPRLNIGELGLTRVLAATVITSAFQFFVTHVVGIGSKKEMIRTDANWIVAFVQYVKCARVAKCQEPREAVRSVLAKSMPVASTLTICRPLPLPTAVALFDISPKPFGWSAKTRSVTGAAAELGRRSFVMRWHYKERSAALLTHFRDTLTSLTMDVLARHFTVMISHMELSFRIRWQLSLPQN